MTSSAPDEPLLDDVLTDGEDERREDGGRRRLSGGKKALIASLSILVILALGIGATAMYIHHRIESRVERIPDPFESLTERPTHVEPTEGTEGTPVNFLVLGSDSRISAGDASQWQVGAQRTDAIMVVHLSGDRQSAIVMSIPRDSWVPIPGHGENKVNAAFSFGGPSLMIQTVEEITGIPIDHFVVSDFESFATITDELGGVDLNLPNGLQGTTRDGRAVDLPPGNHRLDGEEALMYARDRTNVPGGDFGRVQRQQNWMRALMSAAIREGALTNPVRALGLAETVAETLTVDESLSITGMAQLALSARDIRPGDVTFLTAPYVGTGWSPDGRQSIVELDWPAFEELSLAISEDRAAEYLEENPDVGDRLGMYVE